MKSRRLSSMVRRKNLLQVSRMRENCPLEVSTRTETELLSQLLTIEELQLQVLKMTRRSPVSRMTEKHPSQTSRKTERPLSQVSRKTERPLSQVSRKTERHLSQVFMKM